MKYFLKVGLMLMGSFVANAQDQSKEEVTFCKMMGSRYQICTMEYNPKTCRMQVTFCKENGKDCKEEKVEASGSNECTAKKALVAIICEKDSKVKMVEKDFRPRCSKGNVKTE